MNYVRRIEVTQALIAVILSNYGEIGLYLLLGNPEEAFLKLIPPSWALTYPAYISATMIAHTCLGYASFLVLNNGTVEGTLSEICKASLILYTVNLMSGWLWRILLLYVEDVVAAWCVVLLMDSLALITPALFFLVKPKSVFLFIPYMIWLVYITAYSAALGYLKH